MIDLLDSPTMDSPNGSTPTSTMQYPLVLDAFFPAHLTAIQNGMALLMVPIRLQLCYVLFREASLLQGYVFSDFLKAKSLVNAVDGYLQFVFVSLWMVYPPLFWICAPYFEAAVMYLCLVSSFLRFVLFCNRVYTVYHTYVTLITFSRYFFGLFIPFVVLPSFLYGISFLPLCQLLGIVSTSNLEILEFAGQTCFEQLFVNWMPFIETAINSVLCSIIVVQYIRFKSTDPDDYFEPLTKAAQVWWSVRCLWIFLIHIINAILFFVIRYFKNQWIIYAISYHITVISPMLDLLVYDLLLYLGQTMKEDIWVVKKIIADLIEAAETLKEKAMSKHRASVTPIVEIEMENRAPDTENDPTTEPVPATA
ncbi:hypothetical protein L5515_016977 [Caenorhabditis briggsae]|uniref:Uncharacterized protein n=1 Tax=Caenorhabditis briggsae TaxID=6238 RepID=A0AAE9FDL5_CAEBR|nr:hypothetical protein L5515_016977 [Caenorhabditis briggsae]